MRTLFNIIIVLTLVAGCTKRKEDSLGAGGRENTNCPGPAKSFSLDVNPIIQSSCATSSGCHGSGSATGPGPLLTYSQIFNARFTIRAEVSAGHMPPNGGLQAAQKAVIMCWIDNGAPNN
jgi:hypothetical protein